MSMSRYHRQMLLPEIGEAGQEKFRRARVLLIGAGGLGTPVALALTGAGIGTLGIVDDDAVGLTNLHRQLLYDETVIGQPKAEMARERLHRLNSEVNLHAYPLRITQANAETLLEGYDIVVDTCDNFQTRYLLDDLCQARKTPYIYGAVGGWEGQVSVFHYGDQPRRYRDLFPDEAMLQTLPAPGKEIMASTTGVVGNVMAQQVFEIVGGFGEPLAGKLWTINLLTQQSMILEF